MTAAADLKQTMARLSNDSIADLILSQDWLRLNPRTRAALLEAAKRLRAAALMTGTEWGHAYGEEEPHVVDRHARSLQPSPTHKRTVYRAPWQPIKRGESFPIGVLD